jgi:hypothetical protein
MHSKFFFQFLDSYCCETGGSEEEVGGGGWGYAEYKYELVTRIEDGRWGLVAGGSSVQEVSGALFKGE